MKSRTFICLNPARISLACKKRAVRPVGSRGMLKSNCPGGTELIVLKAAQEVKGLNLAVAGV